jgi:hypothetical protein
MPSHDKNTVLVLGNPDFEPDSLPLRILPELRKKLPEIDFFHADPNETWDISGDITVIDTGINLTEPRIFESLDAFEDSPRVSMHDFDALANLKLMQKLGKIGEVRILALPPGSSTEDATAFVCDRLS